MTIFQSIVLGIVQGLTEFLPISSSGHLVIVPYLLNWNIPPAQAFVFDVLVQVATLIALFAYFWMDLVEIVKGVVKGLVTKKPFESINARLGWLLILASVPAGILGLFLKDAVEKAFSNAFTTALFLFGTALLLVIAELVGKRKRELKEITWIDAIWIGVFQAISIFPGISRSGSTITGGMTRNFDRPASARFAFLMSIPIMIAAGLLATIDLIKLPNLATMLPVFIPGFIVAAITGYLAIRWLLRYLVQHTLYDFAIYCVVVGIITMVVFYIRL
jgi:undecaprenyl-diphosphatase